MLRRAIILSSVLATSTGIAYTTTTSSPSSDCKEASCRGKTDAMKLAFQGKTSPQLDRESLGRAGWTLLHAVAAQYPEVPSEEDELAMKQFIQGFARFYPCKDCAEQFRRNVKQFPPRVESRVELSVWVCEEHNRVNAELGKPVFSCNVKELFKRWKD